MRTFRLNTIGLGIRNWGNMAGATYRRRIGVNERRFRTKADICRVMAIRAIRRRDNRVMLGALRQRRHTIMRSPVMAAGTCRRGLRMIEFIPRSPTCIVGGVCRRVAVFADIRCGHMVRTFTNLRRAIMAAIAVRRHRRMRGIQEGRGRAGRRRGVAGCAHA